MEDTRLLRRDVPLEAGRRVRFRFTVDYEVTLDEDLLDYESEPPQPPDEPRDLEPRLQPITLAEIEERLSDRYGSSESLLKTMVENYDRELVEHEATLSDVDDSSVRFESVWERESRLRGESWMTREWLDEIPPARPVMRHGGCITVIQGDIDEPDAFCQRERGHSGPHTADVDEAARLDTPSSVGASEQPTAEEVMERDG